MSESSPDYDAWFRRYAEAYESALSGRHEANVIRSFFTEEFLAMSLAGEVRAGVNDESFIRTLEKGYAFYRVIGTHRVHSRRVETQEICEGHDRVRVFYEADYKRRDGSSLSITFDVVYLLQRRPEGPKIFAYIAGDEMGLYRQHGLVDRDGKPRDFAASGDPTG